MASALAHSTNCLGDNDSDKEAMITSTATPRPSLPPE